MAAETCDDEKREHDEANDSHGPSEPDGGLLEEFVDDDGPDDASEGGSGDDDADCGAAFDLDVLAD